jgi:hypothetical protein
VSVAAGERHSSESFLLLGSKQDETGLRHSLSSSSR